MVRVKFYDLYTIEDSKLKFAVIMSRFKDKWIFVKHKDRLTWEIPGGHREKNEDINFAASRELKEETGAKEFNIIPICIYSVYKDGVESFEQLFYANITYLDKLPNYEISEINLFDTNPENLTYPLIQPHLFKKGEEFYEKLIKD
ncbi:NUDIX hydrolase [Alkaliphilus sp. B6464]|uniref:NUDIX hydrolase n=1 Tax=Alkaliphilus sp. B6464 TaxID=2731219 RepID=UPI001BA52777|nr:NUDIX domain-containing protein [Alkaliphilus sp. B6464]QUH21226.1 NUDIX domain-containing protein [Alkaliphilus sp. B6464]